MIPLLHQGIRIQGSMKIKLHVEKGNEVTRWAYVKGKAGFLSSAYIALEVIFCNLNDILYKYGM